MDYHKVLYIFSLKIKARREDFECFYHKDIDK